MAFHYLEYHSEIAMWDPRVFASKEPWQFLVDLDDGNDFLPHSVVVSAVLDAHKEDDGIDTDL